MSWREKLPILASVLREDTELGLAFNGAAAGGFRAASSTPPLLKYYAADTKTEERQQHNLRWAGGKEERPCFQFIYLMLPTKCNLRCRGCFQGQDKERRPQRLNGSFISVAELVELAIFAHLHGTKALVYGGGGELFMWKGAWRLLEMVASLGLSMVIFTNGTLLKASQVKHLHDLGAVLIISLRDTAEAYHDQLVGRKGSFRRSLATIEAALELGFQAENRLAIEIPVIRPNQARILEDFLR